MMRRLVGVPANTLLVLGVMAAALAPLASVVALGRVRRTARAAVLLP